MQTNPLHRRVARGLVVTLLSAALLVLVVPVAHGQPAAHADDDHSEGTLELVLDSSGSMQEPAAGGQSKIQAARQALHSIVDDLRRDERVGLRVYGATVFSSSDPGACTDSQQVVPIGPVTSQRKQSLHQAINSYRPYGETPIAYSLKQAAHDLGANGERTIVLVSDGEGTCNADPCKVARMLADKGIDLTIDVVGLDVSRTARQQLQCIADAGGGTYYDAHNADELKSSLGKLSTRAFREFSVSGKPVDGSTRINQAPTIRPGRYVTTLNATDHKVEYFSVQKTPGSSLWVSVTARPPHADTRRQSLGVLVIDPQQNCQAEDGNWARARSDLRIRPVLVAATMVDARHPDTKACAAAGRVLVVVKGEAVTGPTGDWKAQLTIVEEPAVHDTSDLPAAVPSLNHNHKSSWRGGDNPTPVVGGTEFDNAPVLEPGQYTDTIVPGERLLYRVPATFGQHVAVDAYLPHTDPATSRELPHQPGSDLGSLLVYAQMYGPGYGHLTRNGSSSAVARVVQPLQGKAMKLKTPEIRYLNRTDKQTYPASAAGYYYIEIDAQEDHGQTYTVPFQLRVRVTGEPTGGPADGQSHTVQAASQATPREHPTPTPTNTTTSGRDTAQRQPSPTSATHATEHVELTAGEDEKGEHSALLLGVGGGALGVLAIGAAVAAALVRRRS